MLNTAIAGLGSDPLITYYDADSRIELSGTTFCNWVAKTANLLDDLGAQPGDTIALGVAETHPAHWVSLIWTAAAWIAGGSIVLEVSSDADFAVVGADDRRRAQTTVACSLHPLGRGFEQPPPEAIDYAEVLAQPDFYQPQPIDPSASAWAELTHRGLEVPGRADRLGFVDPKFSWPFVSAALLSPIYGGGSSVLVCGLSEAEVSRALSAERAQQFGGFGL